MKYDLWLIVLICTNLFQLVVTLDFYYYYGCYLDTSRDANLPIRSCIETAQCGATMKLKQGLCNCPFANVVEPLPNQNDDLGLSRCERCTDYPNKDLYCGKTDTIAWYYKHTITPTPTRTPNPSPKPVLPIPEPLSRAAAGTTSVVLATAALTGQNQLLTHLQIVSILQCTSCTDSDPPKGAFLRALYPFWSAGFTHSPHLDNIIMIIILMPSISLIHYGLVWIGSLVRKCTPMQAAEILAFPNFEILIAKMLLPGFCMSVWRLVWAPSHAQGPVGVGWRVVVILLWIVVVSGGLSAWSYFLVMSVPSFSTNFNKIVSEVEIRHVMYHPMPIPAWPPDWWEFMPQLPLFLRRLLPAGLWFNVLEGTLGRFSLLFKAMIPERRFCIMLITIQVILLTFVACLPTPCIVSTILLLIIFLVYITILILFRPYVSKGDWIMQLAQTISQIVIVILVLILQLNPNTTWAHTGTVAVLYIACFLSLLAVVWTVLKMVLEFRFRSLHTMHGLLYVAQVRREVPFEPWSPSTPIQGDSNLSGDHHFGPSDMIEMVMDADSVRKLNHSSSARHIQQNENQIQEIYPEQYYDNPTKEVDYYQEAEYYY